MSKRRPNRNDELKRILADLFHYYKEPTTKLVLHLQYHHKYSLDDIASIIGVSKQHLSQSYLKKSEE